MPPRSVPFAVVLHFRPKPETVGLLLDPAHAAELNDECWSHCSGPARSQHERPSSISAGCWPGWSSPLCAIWPVLAAGGGPGAALGAAIGGATGIFGGVASTPPPLPGTYFGYPAYGPPAYGYPGYPQPGYGYPGYSGYPAYSGPPSYGYPGYSAQPAYPGPPAYGSPSNSGYPPPPAYGYPSRPPYSPYSGIGDGYPVARYPGDRPSEDWSPGAEYGIEPAS